MSAPVAPASVQRNRSRRGLPALGTRRGVALLMVVVAIAILTVTGAEFAYNARVDLQLAANQRDEVRAYFLARSGIGLARLLLKFQKQLDQIQMPDISKLLGGVAPSGLPPGLTPSLSIQLWRMAKVDCHMLQAMVKSDGKDEASQSASSGKFAFDEDGEGQSAAQPRRSFGGFEGCFQASISDEEEKINLNRLDAPAGTAQILVAQALALFGDKKYEFVFEKEDANKVKSTPQEVLIAMRDWVDEDEVQATLNLSGQAGVEPFVRGFSDENSPYDKLETRYRAKNGRMDSLEELFMVSGVNDRFMAAFADKLTVYPDPNSRMNINTDDPILLELAVRSIADPSRPDARLSDPVFMDAIVKKIRSARMFAIFGMSLNDFVAVVESAGVVVNPQIKSNPQANRWVGDKTSTFRITSVGEAGSVTKKVTAVIRTDEGLGKLLYWREQ